MENEPDLAKWDEFWVDFGNGVFYLRDEAGFDLWMEEIATYVNSLLDDEGEIRNESE